MTILHSHPSVVLEPPELMDINLFALLRSNLAGVIVYLLVCNGHNGFNIMTHSAAGVSIGWSERHSGT